MGLPTRDLVKGQLGLPHSIVAGFQETVNETPGVLRPGP